MEEEREDQQIRTQSIRPIMSNTPQTDKLHNARHETDPLSAYYLMRDLARQLEIEREDALNAWRMSSVCRRLAEERDNLEIALEELEESRDFWRKAALNPHKYHDNRPNDSDRPG